MHFLETFLSAGQPSLPHSAPTSSAAPNGFSSSVLSDTAGMQEWILSLLHSPSLPPATTPPEQHPLPPTLGPALLFKLFHGLAGESARELVNHPEKPCLCGVLSRAAETIPPPSLREWAYAALQAAVPEVLATPQEKQEVWEAVCHFGERGREGGREGRDRREIFAVVGKFAEKCRERERKTRRKGRV